MATRLRLLIYKGDAEWIASNHGKNDYVQGTRQVGRDRTISSIELNPLRITILELLRLFWREEK